MTLDRNRYGVFSAVCTGWRARRRRRRSVVRIEEVSWDALDRAARDRLLPVLRAIFTETYVSASLAEYEAQFFSRPGITLTLYYGADDAIVGYSAWSRMIIERDGQRVTVLKAGLLMRADHRGGRAAGWYATRKVLRERLRHPFRRMAFVSVVISPAMYRLYVSHVRRAWPRRDAVTPAAVHALQGRVVHALGLSVLGRDPWVVSGPTVPADPDWLARTRALRHDPHVHHYVSLVPTWAQGHGVLLWSELGFGDLVGAAARLAWGGLRRAARAWRR